MDSELAVCYAVDKNFIQHFTVALTSLLENNQDLEISVFVISEESNHIFFGESVFFIKKRFNVTVNLFKINQSLVGNLWTSDHISVAAYYRFFIADLLPTSVHKVLYLDSDTIVNGSIKELANIQLENYTLRAVMESELKPATANYSIDRLRVLGFTIYKYFNSGVLLINLDAWREMKVSNQLVKIAQNYGNKLVFWDQDALNICFAEKWGMLENIYNSIYVEGKRLNLDDQNRRPIIFHYTSPIKPWHYYSNHPYKHLYWKYLRLTPYKRYIPKDFNAKTVIKKIFFKLTSSERWGNFN